MLLQIHNNVVLDVVWLVADFKFMFFVDTFIYMLLFIIFFSTAQILVLKFAISFGHFLQNLNFALTFYHFNACLLTVVFFLKAVRDPVPFLTRAACCFRLSLTPGVYQYGSLGKCN